MPISSDTTPARSPGSVRRTTSLDVLWPAGPNGVARFEGVGRDLLTKTDGTTDALAADAVSLDIDLSTRQVIGVSGTPKIAVQGLVGARIGRGFRAIMAETMADEIEQGSLISQLLDDMTGASIVSSFALALWDDGSEGLTSGVNSRLPMAGVCLGFAPGSSALAVSEGGDNRYSSSHVESVVDPDDPMGWHDIPDRSEMSLRRVRRIDVRLGTSPDGPILVDSMFQDSATTPEGGRRGVHQYGVMVAAEPADLRLLSVAADPRILPYAECPMAALGLTTLVGTTLPALRDLVPVTLKGVSGCTHLNDAMRALSCVGNLSLRLTA